MDYTAIYEQLSRWQPDELLFRDNVMVQWGNLSREEFLARHGDNLHLLEQGSRTGKVDQRRLDELVLGRDRNVSVLRYPRYLPMRLHAHEFFEVAYVLTGECVQHLRDGNLPLSQGDLCMIAPGIEHAIEVFDDDTLVLTVNVRCGAFLDFYTGSKGADPNISQFYLDATYSQSKPRHLLYRTDGDEMTRNLMLEMYIEEHNNADGFSGRQLCCLLAMLFTRLARKHEAQIDAPRSEDGRERIIEYIASNYADVTIDRLAEEFHFSRQHCSRIVKEQTGLTFLELLTGIRLRQSETLLKHTDLSIAEISSRVGYKNPETFIRLFKRRRGCTPGVYRKESGES